MAQLGGTRLYERFIARQPIFDLRMKVFGYELLFRAGPENIFRPSKEASTSVIADSVTLFDLQALTGNSKAFINADQAALLRGSPRILPPDRIVVEVLESVAPSREIVEACSALIRDGYTLALDDFNDEEKWAPLIPLVKFLKVDFRASATDARKAIAKRHRSNGIQLLAEKVETAKDVEEAKRLGYSYFQGFFFCKPSMVESRDIPANKMIYLQLLAAIAVDDISFKDVEEILKKDPSLTYRLLRYLNSPLRGVRSEIHSIHQAIVLLGESEFRRWVSIVAIAAMAGDKTPELVRLALTRAYFCEEFAQPVGMLPKSSDLFFMGLLSVTDALLDRPIEQILATVPVSAEVRAALTGGTNKFRDVYDTLLAYERADWKRVTATVNHFESIESMVPVCYMSAANRAGTITG
jgi:EAL and modified HD-GYP domain-containing signal transduction protein